MRCRREKGIVDDDVLRLRYVAACMEVFKETESFKVETRRLFILSLTSTIIQYLLRILKYDFIVNVDVTLL